MSFFERANNSLEGRMLRLIVRYSIFLGLVCFCIGAMMYYNAILQDSMKAAYDRVGSDVLELKAHYAVEKYCERVYEIFRGVDNIKDQNEDYYARFDEIHDRPGYRGMREYLSGMRTADMSDFFLAVADEERGQLVFVADTDPREGHEYPLGKTVGIPGFLQRYFFRSGQGEFPHSYYYLPGRGLVVASASFVKGSDSSKGVLIVLYKAYVAAGGLRRFVWQFVISIGILMSVVGLFLTRRIKKTVVTPINDIAGAAEKYMKDRRNGTLKTAYFSELNIRTGDEIENLGLVMADMEQDLKDFIQDLAKVTAEKERMSAELDLATSIQQNALPNKFPPFPGRGEFDIFAGMDPAREVGGDFYDFFMTDSDHLAVVVGDVSGKGIPAALFMMTARTMLKDAALSGLSPAQMMNRVNAQLAENNRDNMFVTVWVGILEISSGRLVWADAGHEKPALFHGGQWSILEKRGGVALAAFEPELLALDEEPAFAEQETLLRPGDVILQYTDGVTEAMTAERKLFGEERLLEALSCSESTDPGLLLPHIRSRIDAFVAGVDQFDDITMLALRYNGAEKA